MARIESTDACHTLYQTNRTIVGIPQLELGPKHKGQPNNRGDQQVRVKINVARTDVGALGAVCDPVPPGGLHCDHERLALWTVLPLVGVRIWVHDRRQPTARGKMAQRRGIGGR